MGRMVLICLIVFSCVVTAYQQSGARGNDYRTFEIIAISDGILTLRDSDGNTIEVDRDSEDFRVGYMVRYDSIRNRLRHYRWQDYRVKAISRDTITLQHKTGDILSLPGNYSGEFEIGDEVRYDSVGKKLEAAEEPGGWKQYAVVEAASDRITLQDNYGQQIILYLDNNIYQAPRGLFIARYKVGDLVRYNARDNKLRKGVIRTYDWQEFYVKKLQKNRIVLVNDAGENLILENIYGVKVQEGDRVKYDRINNLLKKIR